jgi:hypothetical protein
MAMTKQRFVWITVVGGAIAALVGCELVVDFDRSKIPADSTDAGQVDVSTQDFDATTTEGGGDTDSSTVDSGTDGTVFDTGTDGTVFDAGTDSSFDAAFDADGM